MNIVKNDNKIDCLFNPTNIILFHYLTFNLFENNEMFFSLQPLMDNLESGTYEVFEKDPVKYSQYQKVREFLEFILLSITKVLSFFVSILV